MRRQGNRVLKKLRGRAGETLGETMIALLIGALALVMLAGAVSAGSNMINNSRKKLTGYYEKNENVVTQAASGEGPNTIKITDNTTDAAVDNLREQTITVSAYSNNEFGSGKAVISYKYNKTPGGGTG